MSFLRYGQFAWMTYSRWGRKKVLYRGVKILFVRHVNGLMVEYNIPLALLAAVRILAEGVNAEFAVMPRSLICSHFCNDLSPASSHKAIQRSREPPIDRWWLLLAFNGRFHLRDQLNAWRIDDCSSCCWLLWTMSLTSPAKNKWLHVSSSTKSLKNIRKRRGPSTEPWGTPLLRYLWLSGGRPILL